jgi:hypothetical protein
MNRPTIDFRAADQRQHDPRILEDGSIRVDPGELLDLKTRIWLDKALNKSKEKGTNYGHE